LRYKFVHTKNVKRLFAALAELKDRCRAVAGLGVLLGNTGAGKSTALKAAIAMFDAIFIRVNATVSLPSLLSAICYELGFEAPRSPSQKLEEIIARLREKPYPLFIDEADYLTRDGRMLEVLRDIHDITGVPVMLIGMEAFERKLERHPQFARRVTQRVEFKPCDLADATQVAKELCEVEVAPDLIKKMHTRTKGSVGLIAVALDAFEALARDNNWKAVSAEQWGNRPMFLGDKAEA